MKKRDQAALVKKQRRANRVLRFLRMIWRTIFLAVLICTAVFAVTIFFKIEVVTVDGASRYSTDEIVAGMDVGIGDNLYLFNKFKTADELMFKLPYISTVQIRRRLPNKLVVTITECEALAAVPTDGGFYLVSGEGKVLEQSVDNKGLPVVTGASLMGSVPGNMVDPSKDAYTNALLTILQTLNTAEMLSDTDFINMQSLTDVRIGYAGRFDIRIGTVDSLAYRMRFAKFVIGDRLSPSDVGRLYWDSKGRLHFIPDTLENVQKSGFIDSETPDANGPDDTPVEGQETDGGVDNPDGGTPSDESDEPGDENSDENPDEVYDDTGEYDDTGDESQDSNTDGDDYEDYSSDTDSNGYGDYSSDTDSDGYGDYSGDTDDGYEEE